MTQRKGKYNEKTIDQSGRITTAYQKWSQMMHRCYDPKYRQRKPTYRGCSVCEEWHDFNTFLKWYNLNYREGFDLDKDILSDGNKVYSPDVCLFVPHYINMQVQQPKKGRYLTGVSQRGKRYYAAYGKNEARVYLGVYNTEMEAHQAYRRHKAYEIEKMATLAIENGDIDWRVYDALINR